MNCFSSCSPRNYDFHWILVFSFELPQDVPSQWNISSTSQLAPLLSIESTWLSPNWAARGGTLVSTVVRETNQSKYNVFYKNTTQLVVVLVVYLHFRRMYDNHLKCIKIQMHSIVYKCTLVDVNCVVCTFLLQKTIVFARLERMLHEYKFYNLDL